MTWTDPEFLARAYAWIHEHAPGEVLAIEQPHVRPWSTAMRVETSDGVVWFKANAESQRYEAGATAILVRVAPDALPELLAADVDSGWMLQRDAGERLRELVVQERSLERWHEALCVYAHLQRAAVPAVDELLAAGVPDRRLAVLPDRFAELHDPRLRELAPRVRALAARLAAFGIPETIQHDDLHDAQLFVREGRTLITDWGDAVIAHPFLSLAVALEGVVSWGVDDVEASEDTAPYAATYLAAWGDGLDVALRLAMPLGWACRCVASDPAEGPEALEPRVEMLRRALDRAG